MSLYCYGGVRLATMELLSQITIVQLLSMSREIKFYHEMSENEQALLLRRGSAR